MDKDQNTDLILVILSMLIGSILCFVLGFVDLPASVPISIKERAKTSLVTCGAVFLCMSFLLGLVRPLFAVQKKCGNLSAFVESHKDLLHDPIRFCPIQAMGEDLGRLYSDASGQILFFNIPLRSWDDSTVFDTIWLNTLGPKMGKEITRMTFFLADPDGISRWTRCKGAEKLSKIWKDKKTRGNSIKFVLVRDSLASNFAFFRREDGFQCVTIGIDAGQQNNWLMRIEGCRTTNPLITNLWTRLNARDDKHREIDSKEARRMNLIE